LSVTHVYAPGAHTVTVRVQDARGNERTESANVTVAAPAPPVLASPAAPKPAPAPRCVLPSVKKNATVSSVRKLLARGHCVPGKLVQQRSTKVRKGRVVSLRGGAKVTIVVSRGRR